MKYVWIRWIYICYKEENKLKDKMNNVEYSLTEYTDEDKY